MIAYLFDTMGYLSGSHILDGFFAFASVCICIMVIRKIFERGE